MKNFDLETEAYRFSRKFLNEEDENSPFEAQACLIGFKAGIKLQEKHTEEILRRFIQNERLQFKQKQGDLSIKELIRELEKNE